MKKIAWLYTALVASALVSPMLQKTTQLTVNEGLHIATDSYTDCDLVNDPGSCISS